MLLASKVCAKPKVLIKFTNAHCESFNKSWAVINECRLHALRRDVASLNINITFRHPANDIKLYLVFLKKANGYKPFVLNSTVDACEYIIKKNNPIVNLVYTIFKSFSNINHTCPYVGDQLLLNFYPKNELITLFLPNGDYVLLMDWILSKKKTFTTNVYFSFYG
ncbi:PREDICTED: uncharacterized protein LOC108978128 [Bactrocera latifrons]|uniref:uncharacterized protein LOC108978128 n=1 Tax=Bactrocera latifrons TaxID=174628 RepID=UPI0008DCFF97|nr:PREDICTED: uncharacterized protein LOC108978128 [Bactrocera latifrons]